MTAKKTSNHSVRLCIAQHTLNGVSQSFIKAHADYLPATVSVVHGAQSELAFPQCGAESIRDESLVARIGRSTRRFVMRQPWRWQDEIDDAFVAFFRRRQVQVVLAEYGPTGVKVMRACRRAGVPLIVHFHGADAARFKVLERYQEAYAQMFGQAAAVIAVSRSMENRLLAMGAPPAKLHYNPYGVDSAEFQGADPGRCPPEFLAVGNFVEKKAPHLTILAFSRVLDCCADARLTMLGDGPLRGACEDLALALGIHDRITFVGAQPHAVVARHMRASRAFVQHSVQAIDGDCEGTPVAIIEAGASGLPVVSTRHAGIRDVVIEGQTGLLVDERDIDGMAREMRRLAEKPELAAELGRAARLRVQTEFSMDKSIDRLWSIISSCVDHATASASPASEDLH